MENSPVLALASPHDCETGGYSPRKEGTKHFVSPWHKSDYHKGLAGGRRSAKAPPPHEERPATLKARHGRRAQTSFLDACRSQIKKCSRGGGQPDVQKRYFDGCLRMGGEGNNHLNSFSSSNGGEVGGRF